MTDSSGTAPVKVVCEGDRKRGWLSGVAPVLAAAFVGPIGVQGVSVAVPRMVQQLHLSTVDVGWFVTAFSVPALVVTLPLGLLADRLGRRTMLVAAILLYSLSGLASGLTRNFMVILGLRVLCGIGFAVFVPLTIAVIGDVVPREWQGRAQGYRVVSMSTAEFVFPLMVSGIIAINGNWQLTFAVFLLPGLVAIWCALTLPRSDRRAQPSVTDPGPGTLRSAIQDRRILGLTIAGGCRWFVKYTFFAFVPLFATEVRRLSVGEVGLLMGLAGLLSAVAAWGSGRIGLGRGGTVTMVGGMVLIGLSVAVIAAAPTIIGLYVCVAAFGVGDGLSGALMNGFLSDLSPTEIRGRVIALSGTARNLGKALSPVLVAPVLGVAGFLGAFVIVGGVGVAAPIYLRTFLRSGLAHAQRPDSGHGSSIGSDDPDSVEC